MLRLTQYHMKVIYKLGKSMFVFDCLSRMENPDMCEEDESLNLQVMAITESQDQCINLTDIKQALLQDSILILLGNLILNVWPESCKELEEELKPYWIHCFNFSLMDSLILLGEDRIVIPSSLREKFLTALHYTHQGITKTLAQARSCAY